MAIENEEVELVKQAKEGNLVSFEKLVRLYQAQIRNGLALRLNVPEEADDLAQETFIVAFNRLQNFDPNMPFLPWLRGIAFNLLKNYFLCTHSSAG